MYGATESINHVSKLIYEVDEHQLKCISTASLAESHKILDYNQLSRYLSEINFKLEIQEPDAIRYTLLRNNLKSGMVEPLDIFRNEVKHGFWYTRESIKDRVSYFTRNRNSENFPPVQMVYATKSS